MRLPNGYGSVTKLSGNRRRPYWVRRTVGWKPGRKRGQTYPVYETIGYAETREEGLQILALYNQRPYNIDVANITLAELFDLWYNRGEEQSYYTRRGHRSAYRKLAALHGVVYAKVNYAAMQGAVDAAAPSVQKQVKALLGNLDKYALKLEIPIKQHARLVTVAPYVPTQQKTPYSNAEIAELWALYADEGETERREMCQVALIMLYGGWRIGEIEGLEPNLTDLTLAGGIKTKAGKKRVVPIHPRIEPIVRELAAGGWQFTRPYSDGRKGSGFYRAWNRAFYSTNIEHTPHECRHTFRSELDRREANKKCIDMLMGHKSKDVGERVYTHKTLTELRETVESIAYLDTLQVTE